MFNNEINELGKFVIDKINSEEWKENDKIPSEGFFEIKFNLSNSIVRKTLNKLIKARLIYTKERVGYFVQPNNLRGMFRRESKTDSCTDFAVVNQDVSKYFKLSEISKFKDKIRQLEKVKIPESIFGFKKLYFSQDDLAIIKKVSFSVMNKKLVDEATFDSNKSLHTQFVSEDNLPFSRIVFSHFQESCPILVRKTLGIKEHEGIIVKYVVLLNYKNQIIHAAKIFINVRHYQRIETSAI